ncbi:MAG: hypothetical protein ACLFPW_04840 [Spirochaetaceae bacterium]
MKRLAQFYDLMAESATLRRDLVDYYLINVGQIGRTAGLKKILEQLEKSPADEKGRLRLTDEEGREILVQPDYEMAELEKDLYFFQEGEEAFASYLAQLHPRFGEEVTELLDFLGTATFDRFFTDRDGTVNNYCGRYRSSIQSAYNAVFLSRFGRSVRQKPVILTSAPLQNMGLIEMTVIPEDIYLLAGSKGREYRSIHGERRSLPMSAGDTRLMSKLNAELQSLLEKPENRVFTQIGSSFQRKLGETTVARQDMYGSVPAEKSEAFKREVQSLLGRLNQGEERFHLEDTGKDLEIILAPGEGEPHFDKGDGVAFILQETGGEVTGRNLLICGDTASDLPMVQKAAELGAKVTAIFVTTDEGVRRAVKEAAERSFFVSTPDVLVAGLNLASGETGV